MPSLSLSAVVTAPGEELSPVSVTVAGNQVRCYDPQLRHQETFAFHQVFGGLDEFASTAYASQIYPLVQKTIDGEATVAVICGPASLDVRSHVLSPESGASRGLLSAAAGDLIVAAQRSNNGHATGSVTFSWFKIDTSSAEGITDILKNASGSPGTSRNPPPSLSATTSSSSSSSSSHSSSASSSAAPHCDMNLLVREVGRGRGMFVPGLWEVEIANGADVDAVVTHVTQVLRSADHSRGAQHTVFSLTYKPAHLSLRGGGGGSASKGSYLVAGGSNDPPGLGRLTFLLLSDLSPATATPTATATSAGAAAAAAAASASGASPSAGPAACYEHLSTALQWLTARRPSPAFHKSRLVLMLRDVLCARQHSAWMLFLPASGSASGPASAGAEVEVNYHWLRLLVAVEAATAASGLVNGMGSTGASATAAAGSASDSRSQRAQAWAATPTKLSSSAAGSPRNGAGYGPSSNSSGVRIPLSGSETEQVLAVQLDAARGELAATATALAATKAELELAQRAHAELSAQVGTSGSSLRKRDAEALRKAQADVRDYDVYRQVMEAAMVRLRAELEAIHAENKALKAERDKGSSVQRAQARAQDEEHKAAIRGYAVTKKALKESEEKLAAAVAQLKRVTKERDVAKAVVLDAHHTAAALRAQEEDVAAGRREVEALRRRAANSAAAERRLAAELDEARHAQRRALARVVELQDENQALREAQGLAARPVARRAPSPRAASPRAASPRAASRSPSPSGARLRESQSRDSLADSGDVRFGRAPSPRGGARSRSPSPGKGQQPTAVRRRSSIRNRLVEPLPLPPPQLHTHLPAPQSPRGFVEGTGSPAPAPHAPPPPASANTARFFHPSPATLGSPLASPAVASSGPQQFW